MTPQDQALRSAAEIDLRNKVDKILEDMWECGQTDAAYALMDMFRPLLDRLDAAEAKIVLLTGAMKADDERLIAAADKIGIAYGGCDTADDIADRCLAERAAKEDAEARIWLLDANELVLYKSIGITRAQQQAAEKRAKRMEQALREVLMYKDANIDEHEEYAVLRALFILADRALEDVACGESHA